MIDNDEIKEDMKNVDISNLELEQSDDIDKKNKNTNIFRSLWKFLKKIAAYFKNTI